MWTTAVGVGRRLGLVAFAMSPLFVHIALTSDSRTPVAVGIPALQFLLVAGFFVMRSAHRYKWLVTIFIGLGLGSVVYWPVEFSLVAASAIPHTAAYVILLALFGNSLSPGREAFVTTVARKVHRTLPGEMVVYTRQVTWAWCVFFVAQLGLSAALFAAAPLSVWSMFVNVLNIPLLIAMFVGEYAFRFIRFRDPPRHDWRTIVSMFAHIRSGVASKGEKRCSAA